MRLWGAMSAQGQKLSKSGLDLLLALFPAGVVHRMVVGLRRIVVCLSWGWLTEEEHNMTKSKWRVHLNDGDSPWSQLRSLCWQKVMHTIITQIFWNVVNVLEDILKALMVTSHWMELNYNKVHLERKHLFNGKAFHTSAMLYDNLFFRKKITDYDC